MSFSVRLTEEAADYLARLYAVVLFEIEGHDLVTVLAVRHQLEDDYH